MSISLAILGCSQRKKLTSRPLQAIERYDGPIFRVLRKHAEETLHVRILSARFGLIPGTLPIPRYDHPLLHNDYAKLQTKVKIQLKRTIEETHPQRIFVCVGSQYWPLLEEALAREAAPASLAVASGGIGGRASQLVHWLRLGNSEAGDATMPQFYGNATLLGTTVRLSRAAVLQRAEEELLSSPAAARRFETWYVAVGQERVAPKWLVSLLFNKPVSRFRTSDARGVLQRFGVETQYAD